MSKASELFTAEEREAISRAVSSAESRTAAEIIPAVTSSSGRYDRAEDVFGLIFALLVLVVGWLALSDGRPSEDWTGVSVPPFGLFSVIVTLLVGFAIGAALATRFPVLRLPFISAREMRDEVERAAGEAFFRLRLRKTAGATGILIYVSVYERMVRVVGDDAIAEKLTQSDWDAVRDLAIEGLRDERPGEGLVAAIERCGDLCAPHFPPLPDDEDELSNELRILD
jgi:putative membrane protein